MSAWNICKPLLISADDVAELKRLAAIGHHEFLKTDRWLPIAKTMRDQCPVLGDDWDNFLTVWNAVDASLPDHSHKEHTMLFYPEACDPVLIEGSLFHPDAGDILHLVPGTHHSVPPAIRDRLSIGMLVSDA